MMQRAFIKFIVLSIACVALANLASAATATPWKETVTRAGMQLRDGNIDHEEASALQQRGRLS